MRDSVEGMSMFWDIDIKNGAVEYDQIPALPHQQLLRGEDICLRGD